MTVPRIDTLVLMYANDNLSPWQQGRADSKQQVWSDRLANCPGSVGMDYLSGWVAIGDRP